MLAIVLHGILRDGITTWMPVYISETFGLSNSVSILTAAVLPVFSILSIYLASALLERLRNEFTASALLFGAAAACSALLVFLYQHGPVPSVILMTLTAGCMYGINLFLISRLPAHFSRFGKVATVSGILNASTYVGSSLSAWLFGMPFRSARLDRRHQRVDRHRARRPADLSRFFPEMEEICTGRCRGLTPEESFRSGVPLRKAFPPPSFRFPQPLVKIPFLCYTCRYSPLVRPGPGRCRACTHR